MLLAIDVGNTQSHVGVFDDHDLIAHWRFATEGNETADELAVRVSALVALEASGSATSMGPSSPRWFPSSRPNTRGCASAIWMALA